MHNSDYPMDSADSSFSIVYETREGVCFICGAVSPPLPPSHLSIATSAIQVEIEGSEWEGGD